jgi:5'(3')-deoxyribonucleotidase
MQIFIDMDGVLTDFVGAVRKITGWWDAWPLGEYDISKACGQNIWPLTNNFNFWHKMERTGEAKVLMEMVEERDYYVCTSPTFCPECASGKLAWLKDNWPHCFKTRRYILTPHKHLLAGYARILIDDSDQQCKDWDLAGGSSILFARPWNSLYEEAYPMVRVKAVLD